MRCAVDADPGGYDLLRSVAGSRPPDTRLSAEWTALPGRTLPPPQPPSGDPYDLDGEHLGFRPVTP